MLKNCANTLNSLLGSSNSNNSKANADKAKPNISANQENKNTTISSNKILEKDFLSISQKRRQF